MSEIKIRDKSFDIAKGIAIIAIILGHLGIGYIDRFLFTFHVPLFFLISGYFYNNKTASVKKYAKRLLVPYLFTSVIIVIFHIMYIIFNMFKNNYFDLLELFNGSLKWITAIIYGSGSRGDLFSLELIPIGAIWFLLALFIALNMLGFILKINKKLIQCVCVVILFIIGWITAKFTWLPFSIQSAFVGLLFIYIGYEVKLNKEIISLKLYKVIISLLVWTAAIFVSYKNELMSLVRACFPNVIINILGACAASYLNLSISKIIENNKNRIIVRGGDSLHGLVKIA